MNPPYQLSMGIVCNPSKKQGITVGFNQTIQLVFKFIKSLLLVRRRETILDQIDTLKQYGQMPRKCELGFKPPEGSVDRGEAWQITLTKLAERVDLIGNDHVCRLHCGSAVFSDPSYPYSKTRDATSAIAFMTALRTPGSYSVWPAPSTTRTSASAQRAASACAVEGGHSRS
jgi:hypothetical protein